MEKSLPAAPTENERVFAMLAHISAFYLALVFSILVTLGIYFAKRRSKFVAFHAIQSLLWQITWIAAFIIFLFVIVPRYLEFFAYYFLESVTVFFALLVTAVIRSGFIGAKAYRGQWTRYPIAGFLAQKIVRP